MSLAQVSEIEKACETVKKLITAFDQLTNPWRTKHHDDAKPKSEPKPKTKK